MLTQNTQSIYKLLQFLPQSEFQRMNIILYHILLLSNIEELCYSSRVKSFQLNNVILWQRSVTEYDSLKPSLKVATPKSI